jgi:hypothetical protein
MLVWLLLGLGIVIIVAQVAFGHRVALMFVALWIAVLVVGWSTGFGVRH